MGRRSLYAECTSRREGNRQSVSGGVSSNGQSNFRRFAATVRSRLARRIVVIAGVGLVLALEPLTGCSHGTASAQPSAFPSTSRPAIASASPSPIIDSLSLPALRAYEAGIRASNAAARHPYGKGDHIPRGADFAKYMFDPLLSQYKFYIWGLAASDYEYRGTPPTINVVVKSVHLAAKPWPTVTLSDCSTGVQGWKVYNAKTGEVEPIVKKRVAPPYRSTVTMILYEKRWGIKKIALDATRTCVP